MKIKQINGMNLLSHYARQRLEKIVYANPTSAAHDVQQFFPNHIVCEDRGRLRVAVRDRSFIVAEFKQIP